MSHTMKNQSTELTKEQRRRLARAIHAIILGKSSVEALAETKLEGLYIQKKKPEDPEDTEDKKSTPKIQSSVMKPRQKSAFAKRRNFNKLSIRI